jgi:serine O-acetyltransferase
VTRALEAASLEPAERARHLAPEPEIHSDRSFSKRPLADVIDALCAANDEASDGLAGLRGGCILPSRDAVASVIDDLRAALFPGHFGAPDLGADNLRAHIAKRLGRAQLVLTEQVRRGLSFACQHGEGQSRRSCAVCDRAARRASDALIARLPAIRANLMADVKAAFDGDPAARFMDETLFCYPGITAITQHRIAHELFVLSVPLIPRIISELAHAATGIDIHPGAEIGPSFFIDHGTGVVIGETCSIGAGVRLYQGVTLGARGFPSDGDGHPVKGAPRHPIVEDGVVIYAGATILGRITIGQGATIGGNVWLTRDVAPGMRVTQAQVRHDTFEQGSGI